MSPKAEISLAHNGRVRITTFDVWTSWKISLLLMLRYGFFRWGTYIPPITDEAVHPSYYRLKLKIHAGWDSWFGYDWLAENEATDVFLKVFYQKHLRKQ